MKTVVDLSVCSAPFRRRVGAVPVLDPAMVFATGIRGVWIDPSDAATLFTDLAGTTPATTPGDLVALALDKSHALARGAELMPSGFGSGTWSSFASGVSVAGGIVTFDAVPAGSNGLLLTAANGSPYQTTASVEVTITISDFVSGGIRLWHGSGYSPVFSGNGTHRFLAVFPADLSLRCYTPSSGGVTSLKAGLSVRELPGAHATQPVLAARPVYSLTGGLPSLSFDGIDDRLIVRRLDLSSGAALTGAAGLYKPDDGVAARVLDLGGAEPTMALDAPATAGLPQIALTVNNGTPVSVTNVATAAPVAAAALLRASVAAPHLAALQVSGGADLASSASSSTVAAHWRNARELHLGQRTDGGLRFAGRIHGLVLFDTALSEPDNTLLRHFMAQKTGAPT